jgi:hypothetical protein
MALPLRSVGGLEDAQHDVADQYDREAALTQAEPSVAETALISSMPILCGAAR